MIEAQQTAVQTAPTPSASERQRALDILAKSLYRELTAQGYDQQHIVKLATALLGEVTTKKSPLQS